MFYDVAEFGDIKVMTVTTPHPFYGKTVYFATKHGKEALLKPLLAELGVNCLATLIDTDEFGTFSGEVERTGSVRETLRKKINAAADQHSEAQFILASEGSFVPHPLIGFMQTDLESLLLWDRETGSEIYAEYLATDPIHAEKILGPLDDHRAFLIEIKFPDHGVIVHPERLLEPLFKGLHTMQAVEQAMLECFVASKTARVVLMTDLRACHNATRRDAIYNAGRMLIESLNSLCPTCEYPGFTIVEGVPGLPCGDCGEPSRIAKAVLLACPRCKTKEERPRPDGQREIDSSECEFCNP